MPLGGSRVTASRLRWQPRVGHTSGFLSSTTELLFTPSHPHKVPGSQGQSSWWPVRIWAERKPRFWGARQKPLARTECCPPRGLCLFGNWHPAAPFRPLKAFKAVGQVLSRWPTEDAEWKQMCGRVWLWARRRSTSGVLGLGVGDAQLGEGLRHAPSLRS